MVFDDLVGKQYQFYGVENCVFRIDDLFIEVVEDEDDGYRSMLGDLKVLENTADIIISKLPIATVVAKMSDDNDMDTMQLVDVNDGHLWLEFGTDESDSYYPGFVFFYSPKANPQPCGESLPQSECRRSE